VLLCTNNDYKFLRVFGIVIIKKKLKKTKKKKKIYQFFQNEMCFPLLHYTSKNKKKCHECGQKNRKKNITSFQWKKIKRFQKMHVKNIY